MSAAVNVCLLVIISLTASIYDASCQDRVGCFVDSWNRLLPPIRRHSSMTVEWCLHSCFTDSLAFAGLQAGGVCLCGNSTNHTKHGDQRPDTECSTQCIGNSHQTCGGSWRLEIYKDLDECLNDNIGGCNHRCVNSLGSYHCTCHTGYALLFGEKLTCTDIDECIDGSHGCNQTCKNTRGAYECSCNDGYKMIGNNSHECADIDECSEGSHQCNQICINTPGRYKCDCIAGYDIKDSNMHTCSGDEASVNLEWNTREGKIISGLIAGLVIACLAFIICLVLLLIFRFRRQGSTSMQTSSPADHHSTDISCYENVTDNKPPEESPNYEELREFHPAESTYQTINPPDML